MSNSVTSWLSSFNDIFQIAAIIIGGTWTYVKYFRGRTYAYRLECDVDATVRKAGDNDQLFIFGNAQLKNVGLSRVPISQDATTVWVSAIAQQHSNPSRPMMVKWDNSCRTAVDVFKNQDCVEPGESLNEPFLLQLPCNPAPAYQVVLQVVSGKHRWTGNADRWTGSAIVDIDGQTTIRSK
jgi:hypothetical protein